MTKTIKIAVIKSGNVFQDLEIGVEARIFRLNENGGVNSRKLEIVKVIDDSGSEEKPQNQLLKILLIKIFLPLFYYRQQPAQQSRIFWPKIICPFLDGDLLKASVSRINGDLVLTVA
ncbi:MAG: hypothetical protein Ct9H90mP30_1070 [Actinomycetota bacterium]|nr:MAG: hypothetical protein Ct9H90mP30_1070 [Actinomycetota bacterium]